MDPLGLIPLARTLVDIDSTTGREGDCGRWLATYLRYLGWTVDAQEVSDDRINVIAWLEPPELVFSTHFDCVPPFVTSRVEGDSLYGRGSCDAKGILAAQVLAAERLRAGGERRVGLVFVVGEERGSDGARMANSHRLAEGCRYLVNGEPTDGRLASATRGILRVKLSAKGRPAHSSRPELGESAIDKLLDALVRLREQTLPDDPVLGRTHYAIGLISGGIAPNVISPHAEAELMFRTVGPLTELEPALSAVRDLVHTTSVLEVPAVQLTTLDGFDVASFPFSTDIPFLHRWGQPLLVGPGSILVAHTDDEHVGIADLEQAVNTYEALGRRLLA